MINVNEEKASSRIKGIVVDAGHGGDDPGAVSGGLREKDFNLEAAKYMYQRFQDLGIPVAITRDTDATLTRQERVNKMKNTFGNTSDVLVISNHINSGGGEGAEIIYALRNDDTLARSILEEIGKEGQVTRKYYQRRLPEDPSQDYYYIMRDTKNTSPLLIEYGFIDNPKDVARLQENLLDYVEAVVRAVARYAGVTYVGPDGEVDNVYTVQKGDSLWSIANRFGVTVDALKEANNLTSNTLQVGQRLVIPSTTPTPPSGEYVTYTVKAGDTLYRLAQQFETSIDAIIDANNLQTTVLSVGQILRIPSNVTTTPEEPTPPATQVYTVQRGDSLWKIAQQFGVSVADLIAANNLTTNTLQVGQQLIIPGSGTVTPPTTTTYTVQRGDTFFIGNG